MLNRLMTIAVFIPLAIVFISLAVANRTPVPFTLDPFNPGNPGLTATMPFFIFLFGALVLGLIIGSVATWFGQGRYRKLARQREADIARAPRAAERPVATQTVLPGPSA
ncbi:LapA family protein [Mesorhizobium sp. CAU 1732]|uniref:LapA family protein n=1 Tax=Mesorhizobium sp. CAU 1732 TaxID=3140358 RepID=UPI003261764E